MKLRLKYNTIRLRLTQDEVSQLAESGYVEEAINFGPQAETKLLIYSVESNSDANTVTSDFGGGKVQISVPENLVKTWAESDEIGISAELNSTSGEPLRVLIEKDLRV